MSLNRGEITVLLGASGTGKTRLLRQIAWLDPLETGELRLDGIGPIEMGVTEWRRRVCYVAQRAPMFDGTAEDVADALSQFGGHKGDGNGRLDAASTLAERWGVPLERWKQFWNSLSGGEQQRMYLAIMVVGEPDILLLDEPTSSLDPDATLAVEQSLCGKTVLWVTHDRQQASRIAQHQLEVTP